MHVCLVQTLAVEVDTGVFIFSNLTVWDLLDKQQSIST
jgi:hypothetical protein